MFFRAVRGEENHQHVFVGVHALAKHLETARQRGDAGNRQAVDSGRVVDQHQRAPLGVEALAKERVDRAHFAQKHVLIAMTADRQHEQLGHAGTARGNAGERLVEQGGLGVEHGFVGDGGVARLRSLAGGGSGFVIGRNPQAAVVLEQPLRRDEQAEHGQHGAHALLGEELLRSREGDDGGDDEPGDEAPVEVGGGHRKAVAQGGES